MRSAYSAARDNLRRCAERRKETYDLGCGNMRSYKTLGSGITTYLRLGWSIRGLGGPFEAWVFQWLGHRALVLGSGVQFSERPACLEIYFSGTYVRRGLFTGIEFVLGPTTWVHFLPVPLD